MKKMKWYSKTYIGVFMAFLYLPLMILVIFSFNESKGRTFTGFTLKWYGELLHNNGILDALMTTVIVSGISSLIATVMGTVAAIGLEKLSNKMKSIFMTLTYIPIVNPEIITGVSFMLLFVTAKNLLENLGVDFQFGWTTLILAHITFNIPYVILNVLPKLKQMDNSLMEAAMDLGCNHFQAFRKVALYEIKPGIIAGFLMALTFSVDDFVVSYFTTGAKYQPLSVMIYSMTKKRVSPEINALSTVIFVTILLILVIINVRERRLYEKARKSNIDFKKVANISALVVVFFVSAIAINSKDFVYADKVEKQHLSKSITRPLDYDYYERFKGQDLEINVYNWGEYLSNGTDDRMDINQEFEKVTGIKVNYSNFETNEGMYAKLKSGANSYDVIFPSDYMVSRLAEEEMLYKLNFENIPNYKYIGENFKNLSYDPKNYYSVPYTWGRVGIIYNEKMIGHTVRSIDELWNPKHKGQILMFKNSKDAFALALMKLGYDINTTDEKKLREAGELLKLQKPLVQAYVMDQIFDKMQGNEGIIAPYYVGDYLIMKKVNPDLNIYIPDNTNMYVDAICIPKNAKNKEAGEMYINFLNEPEVAAENIDFIMYSSPNTEAVKLLKKEIRENKILYPDKRELKNAKSFVNLPKKTNLFIDSLWIEVMSDDAKYLDWVMPLFIVFSLIVIFINSRRRKKKRKKFY